MDYGRNIIGSTGIPVMLSADGNPEWSAIGITIDWTLVAAVGADTVIPIEGLTVRSGHRYLRYGQVLTMVTNLPTQTLTITGTPTGGSFTLSGYRRDTGAFVTTAPIAYNATAAAIAAALTDPSAFGPTPVTVTGTGPFTIATPLATLSATSALTGGTTPAVTVVQATTQANYGNYGPYDPAATDGRAALARGMTKLLNNTVLQDGVIPGISGFASNHPGVLEGGKVWKDRLIATTGTHSLTAGPTFAELEAVLPRLSYAP